MFRCVYIYVNNLASICFRNLRPVQYILLPPYIFFLSAVAGYPQQTIQFSIHLVFFQSITKFPYTWMSSINKLTPSHQIVRFKVFRNRG